MNDRTAPAAIYYVVRDGRIGIWGYAWRLGWSATSFYLKPRYAPLGALKVSLHGPDGRTDPERRPGFRVGLDRTAVEKAGQAGGAWLADPSMQYRWFTGVEVRPGVKHVLRLRSSGYVFRLGAISAPAPGAIRASTQGYVADAPHGHDVVDLDLYLSNARPWWPENGKQDVTTLVLAR